jgi:hypothetical protein
VRTAILLQPDPARAGRGGVHLSTVAELETQVERLGFAPRRVVVPGGTAALAAVREAIRATRGGEDVLLLDASLVVHTAALRALASDARVAAGMLVQGTEEPAQPSSRAVRVDRGVVVELASPVHERLSARAVAVGALLLDHVSFERVSEPLRSTSDAVGESALGDALAMAPTEVLAAAALEAGTKLSAVDIRGLYAYRVDDEAGAERARTARDQVDEDRAWLDAAVKARDGWFTTFFVSPYTRFWARWAARRGLTPNQVTSASMATGALAALLFAGGQRWTAVLGALVLQLSFSLDCVDGQLSRYTQRFTAFGGWLDSTFDRAKEYLVYAGLAVWGARWGDPVIWQLAAVAMAFQAVRHAIDFSFADHRPPPVPVVPKLAYAGTGTPAAAEPTGRVLSAAAAAEGQPLLRWGKRIIVLPIGERFAVISLTAILATPRWTFGILLGWGLVAAAYVLAGRLLRSRRWPADRGRWLATPAVRVVEYGAVLLAGVLVEGGATAAYAALAALVMRHYDEVYRRRIFGPASLRTTASRLLLTWWLRAAIVLVTALLGVGAPVLWVVAAVVGGVTLVDATSAWRRAGITDAAGAGADDDEEGL